MTKTFTKEEGTLVEVDGEIYLLDKEAKINSNDYYISCLRNRSCKRTKIEDKKIIASTRKSFGLPLIDISILIINNKDNNLFRLPESKDFIEQLQSSLKGLEIEMEYYNKPENGASSVRKDLRPKLKDNHIIITNVIY